MTRNQEKEQEDGLEQVYKAVIEAVQEDGFSRPTVQDVADEHRRLREGNGSQSLIGQAMARKLKKSLREG